MKKIPARKNTENSLFLFIKSHFLLIILFCLMAISLGDFFHSGLPKAHDGVDHVARIANFYRGLEEGVIIPRWAENLNWGYGHAILMFLYPFPSYFASFFHLFGFSLVDSVKAVFMVSFLLSGFTMYLWLRQIFNSSAAFVGALLYVYAPYRFVDLYVRGAFGEHVAFVFPPLILYALVKFSETLKYRYFVIIAISLAGLILSHNAISLMFLPIIFLYALYLGLYTSKKWIFIIQSILSGVLGFGLAGFFWMPAFFEGKYTLRDIVTKGEYVNHFNDLTRFFYSPWNYGGSGEFSVQVGFGLWGAVFTSVIVLLLIFRKNKKLWLLCLGLVITFFGSIFIMIPQSKQIWETFTLLPKFQFPWRFLSLSVFSASVLGAIVVYTVPKKIQMFVVIIVVLMLVVTTKDFWRAKGYTYHPENYYTGIYLGTTDTGESAPIWSVRFMEKKPNSLSEIVEGDGVIIPLERSSTQHVYEIVSKETVRVVENTLYFPNWEVFVDGVKTDIEFQDPKYRGLITYKVPSGKHMINIIFNDTKLRFVANMISVISICLLIGYGIIGKRIWKRFQ